jgi:preprotein translocase subunit SecA
MAPALLAERAPGRLAELQPRVGDTVLAEVERRLTLLTIDRCWSDHLAELRELREDSMLLAFAGRFPLAQFHLQAGQSFDALEGRIDDEIVERFSSLAVTEHGVDWEAAGLRGPSATWTYLVGDNPFGASGLLGPLGRTGMVGAAVAMPWLVLLHGAGVLWARYRKAAAARRSAREGADKKL